MTKDLTGNPARAKLILDFEEKRWGCPYWRDADAYPETGDSLKTWEWGWEFVRRNPDFREIYTGLKMNGLSVKDVVSSPGADLIRKEFAAALMIRFSLDEAHDPTLCTSEFDKNPFYVDAGVPISLPSKKWMLEKWDKLSDRGVDTLRNYFEWLITDMYYEGLTQPMNHEVDERPSRLQKRVAFTFDLGRPIKPQLNAAEHYLIEAADRLETKFPHPKLHGKTRDTWPRHLRIVDAKDQGASHSEIFNQFVFEWAGGDPDRIDEYYRPPEPEPKTRDAFLAFAMGKPGVDKGKRRSATQPKQLVSQWVTQARGVMEKVSYLL